MFKTIDALVRGIWSNVGVPDKYLTMATVLTEGFFAVVIFGALTAG